MLVIEPAGVLLFGVAVSRMELKRRMNDKKNERTNDTDLDSDKSD